MMEWIPLRLFTFKWMSQLPSQNPQVDQVRLLYCEQAAVPLQAWSGPEGSRKLRFTAFMTTAQDGGKVTASRNPLQIVKNTYNVS
jgi:hypothetical protein